MQYEGITYRPPPESDSLLIQVTTGCTHNKCGFCKMYRDIKFKCIPMYQIEKDLMEARKLHLQVERIFLVNGDAFALKASPLRKIAGIIKQIFPECRTISMHASILNIMTKSDEFLEEMRSLGFNDLYVGVESGWDDVLKRMNKGYTIADAKHQLTRLNRFGINHISILILGIAGSGEGIKNAGYTAEFVNHTLPSLILLGYLTIIEGTELHTEMMQGSFIPATEIEIREEEKELVGSDLLKTSADILLCPIVPEEMKVKVGNL